MKQLLDIIMKFRKADINDLDALLLIEQKVVDAERPFNPSIKQKKAVYYDIKKLISDPLSLLIIAEDHNNIIVSGYAQIRQSSTSLEHNTHAYLGFMYVDPNYRGQGVNKAIMDRLLLWSKQQGISDCYLDVYALNAAAIRAYEKMGFASSKIEMKLAL